MRQKTLRRFGLAVATAAAMASPVAACTVDLPFSNGSSALNSSVRNFLDGFAAKNPGKAVNLTGYASPDGATSANLALSQARASNVANYLSQASGGSITVATQGVGESAQIGRAVRLSTARCVLPSGEVLTGGAGAGGGALAAGALTPAAAAGIVVGALALGAALAAGGDNNSSTTSSGSSSNSTPGSD